MKKFVRICAIALAVYLLLSIAFSVAFAMCPVEKRWTMARHRDGLLCVAFCEDGIFIYSPFCNYADVWLLGICWDEECWWTFSDGFDCFGEWLV